MCLYVELAEDPRLQSTSQMGMISPLHPLHSHQLLYRDIYSLWNENIEVAEMLVKYNCISTQTTCVCACACVRVKMPTQNLLMLIRKCVRT